MRMLAAGFFPLGVEPEHRRINAKLVGDNSDKGITLQGSRLALITTRHPHITDQHVRQNSNQELSHSLTFRQGLS